MSTTRTLIIVTAASAAAALVGGCDPIECGEGTSERDGTCVPADVASPDDPQCGDGTEFDPVEMACLPVLPPAECGPNTEPVVREDGVIECVGTGSGSCDEAIACPQASGGKVSVCGQLIDTETSVPVRAGDGTLTATCDPDNPTTDQDPCSLELVFYDAIDFVTNQAGAVELGADEIRIDSCGRFRAINITLPGSGFMGVGVDDSTEGSADDFVLSGIAFPVSANLRLDGQALVATLQSTDQAWTTSAGEPFGAGVTFADMGTILITYVHAGLPATGVVITAGGSAVDPANDFYFSDANPAARTTVSSGQNATGANGTALAVGSNLTQHSGEGGEPTGCTWESDLGASPAGVVFATRRGAVMGTEECP